MWATIPGRLSTETLRFEETSCAQGCLGKRAVKERGRQQSLSAAEPQHRWEERPLASALKRQLDSPCCSLLLPGSKPPWQLPHYASFQKLGPCHMRFIISELSYLPVQLMQVSVLSVAAFSQAGLDCHQRVRVCSREALARCHPQGRVHSCTLPTPQVWPLLQRAGQT